MKPQMPHAAVAFAGVITLGACTLLAPMALAQSEIGAQTLSASNTVRQLSPSGTNYFLGRVGIGTQTPGAPLHVLGDGQIQGGLSVSGAMTLPAQGDVSMGTYTAGVSQAGLQGALPLGSEGNLLYHSGVAWAALTNVYFDAASGRLYLNSATNGGTYLETGSGRLVMGGGILLGSNTISRSGGAGGIGIDADGNLSLSGGDIDLGGFSVDESTGDMNAGSNRISSLADPTAAQDAATRHYVDNALTNVPPYGCVFRAYQATVQTIAAGTSTVLRLDTETFDVGGDFTTWTGSDCYFTAPSDGYYVFGAGVSVPLNDGKQLTLVFKKNGAGAGYVASLCTGATAYPMVNGGCLASMAAGDRMRLEVQHNDVISRGTVNLSVTTFLWGYRLK